LSTLTPKPIINLLTRLAVYVGIALTLTNCTIANKKSQKTTDNADDFGSLLWQISGNGLKKPSYLFGTVHLIPEKDYFFSETAKKVFKQAEQLCLEINIDDPEMVTAAFKGYLPKGVSLKKLLNQNDYALLTEKLQAQGIDIEVVNNMKPILVSSMLLERGSTERLMTYETELAQAAKLQKKPIVALETPLAQMSFLDSIPYTEQATMLTETMLNGNAELMELIARYTTQNIDTIYNYIQENTTKEGDFNRILLTQRNTAWLPLIADIAQKKSCFFAVGAGHLGGPKGLVRALRQQGFTVKPVR
jgi:uncharacterized protein